MQETTFKLRIKKWNQSLSVINENTDKLNSTEQEAVKTLCNLWRREQFGKACSDSVDRMVNNMLKNENSHGGNQLFLKEALKDFRSISKEFYTKDEETFRQFAAAAKELLGGPQRTDEQQQRRRENDERRRKEAEEQQRQQQRQREEQQRQQQRQREEQQRQADQQRQREEQERRRREQEQQRQRDNSQRSKDTNKNRSNTNKGFNKNFLWIGLGIGAIVLIAVIGYFVKVSIDNSAAEEQQRRLSAMSLMLKGEWKGEADNMKIKLVIDSLKNDSVYGQISVSQRRKSDSHAVSGATQLRGDSLWLTLNDILDAEAKTTLLNGSYTLKFDKKAITLSGTYTSSDKQQSFDLLLASDGAPATKQEASKDKSAKKRKDKKVQKSSSETSASDASQKAKNSNNHKESGSQNETQETSVSGNEGTGFKLERVKDVNF